MQFIQDLYWDNLPSKILKSRKYNEYTRQLFTSTFLKSIKEPFFLFTGTNAIDFSFLYKDPKLVKKLSKRKVKFFLYEPVSYYFKNKNFNLGYYSEFHSRHNQSTTLHAEELDCINDLGKKINGIVLNHSDYGLGSLLQSRYPYITFKCRDIFLRQAAMSFMPNNPVDIPKITKKFWCGNGRYTIHRHIIMCFLADKPGNYSWWFKGNTDWNSVTDWVENLPTDYLTKNNRILNNNKWELDFSAPKVNIKEKHHLYLPEGPFSQPNIDYKKTFDECFVCIINETRFAQPTANFSEKIIDAINYRKPFIVVAPPKTLEYIKKFGFKTFDKFWDENYDAIENHSQRMLQIFSVIDNINQKSIDELNEMYMEMLPILDHNRNILKTLPRDNKVIDDN
jgi:hypothetical protein